MSGQSWKATQSDAQQYKQYSAGSPIYTRISEAWLSTSGDTMRCSFKWYGIITSLDGSEHHELDCLASVDNWALKERDSLADEALELIFNSASDESFDDFTDSDYLINQARPVMVFCSCYRDSFRDWSKDSPTCFSFPLAKGGQSLGIFTIARLAEGYFYPFFFVFTQA